MIQNFNPRTREGCDASGLQGIYHQRRISIHAPVKGATLFRPATDRGGKISIHAPVKGATRFIAALYVFFIIFQSTHP